MTAALLEARGISKSYGRMQVLKNVDLAIHAGEAHVVIGPNGAGKSTLFKVLSGEVPVGAGTIRFDGEDVTAMPGWRRVRKGIGRTFQTARVFADLTPLENMVVAVEAHERKQGRFLNLISLWPTVAVQDAAAAILEDFALTGVAGLPTKTLSHGDKKRLELAMTVAGRPRLLMLDEPTAGMATADRNKCIDLIGGLLRNGGFSLLLTEHDMAMVFGLATRITVLNYGQVIATGNVQEIRSNARVREIYLGHNVAPA